MVVKSLAFVLLLVVFALVALVVLRFGRVGSSRHGSYRSQKIMTDNELEFFGRLSRAAPDCYVFPQVAMSALVEPSVSDAKKRLALFRRISQKRVDYAIFTNAMKLLCVVELDDKTHDPKKDAARDEMLSSAGIKTIRWHSRKKPSVADIRAEFLQLT